MIQAISPAVVAQDLEMRVNHVHLLSSRARRKIQTYLEEE
jgi:DNA-directed RNA polymerase specialized sigma24 family protein